MTMPRVSYRFAPQGLGADNKVKRNTFFDVILYGRDNRPPRSYTYEGLTRQCPRGIFAAYINVNLETGALNPISVRFNDRYANQRIYRQRGSSSSFFVGGFAGVGSGTPVEVEICRFTVQACELYTPDPNATAIWGNTIGIQRPDFDTLVYGLNIDLADAVGMPDEKSLILPDEIEIKPTQLTIVY